MSMDSSTQINIVLASIWTCDTLSVCIALGFMVRFIQLKTKNCASYLILVLSIFTWIFPIVDVLKIFISHSNKSARLIAAIEMATIYFTIHWTAAIALFTYKRLRNYDNFNRKKYVALATIWCILIIPLSAIPVYDEIWGLTSTFFPDTYILNIQFPLDVFQYKLNYFIIYDIIGRFLPLLGILSFYLMVHKTLKDVYYMPQRSLVKFIWFGLIPILFISPATIANVMCMFLSETRPFGVKILEICVFRCWGFVNLIAYWFPKSSKHDETVLSELPQISLMPVDSFTLSTLRPNMNESSSDRV